ncbi:MAG: SoxR reducing system RseC family protein [Candidatus Schekmanbacteria bacterium]|nr:SoxR reducing system RseC family protein [Candidatus Schekmanbacteria bacterium]
MLLEEHGVVLELCAGQKAVVKVTRSEMCDHCASSSACFVVGSNENEMKIIAHNPQQIQAGHRVILTLPSKTFLQATVIVYLIPFLGLLTGAIIGQLISQPAAIGGAFLGLVLCFSGIWFYNKRIKPDAYIPTINRVAG